MGSFPDIVNVPTASPPGYRAAVSAPAPTPPSVEPSEEVVQRELAREAVTMMLYVSLTLLAALVAIPGDDVPGTLETAALLWGGAGALALTHWLAFDLGARLYRTEGLDRLHRLGGPVSLAAALGVAVVTSIPILLAPDDLASDLAICVLAFMLASAGFAVGRRDGQSVVRSLAGGAIVLVAAGLIVAVKIAIDH
jgi:hypothetical protein